MSTTFDVIKKLQYTKQMIEEAESLRSDQRKGMEQLWDIVVSASNEALAETVISHSDFPNLHDYFSPRWANFIAMTEKDHSAAIVKGNKVPESVLSIEEYDAEVDELVLTRGACSSRNFVMVGCGPFPETIMRICDGPRSFSKIVGLDYCSHSLDLAKQICDRLVKSKESQLANFALADGAKYDYSDAAVVLLANGLKNKKAVLARVVSTIPNDGIILARNPIQLGRILYENIFSEGISSDVKILDSVQPSLLSRTYLMKKVTL